MRALRAIWDFLQTIFRGTWRLLKGIYHRLVALVVGLLGPPAAALRRLFATIRRKLDHLLEVVLTAWARIFQRAPRAPKDRIPTPGRSILVLAGSFVALAFWYLAPWRNWFDLSDVQFEGAVYASSLGVALVLRTTMRGEQPGVVGRFLRDAARRVGLIWFERFAAVAALLAFGFVWREPALRPLPLLIGLGFLVLLASPYEPRALADDLPTIPDLVTEEGEGDHVDHRFRWTLDWDGAVHEFDVAVRVDTQRFAQMQSMNPRVPSVPGEPDFTPWIVSGSTPEVDRVAIGIRATSNQLSYSRFQEAAATLAFAQSMTYSLDEDTTGYSEYWRYPIETIHEETGDCEDTTILAGAVLRSLGHGVLPLLLPGHAALGVAAPPTTEGSFVVHEGRRYYYCETTSEGFKIGQLPSDIDGDTIEIAPLREPRT